MYSLTKNSTKLRDTNLQNNIPDLIFVLKDGFLLVIATSDIL